MGHRIETWSSKAKVRKTGEKYGQMDVLVSHRDRRSSAKWTLRRIIILL